MKYCICTYFTLHLLWGTIVRTCMCITLTQQTVHTFLLTIHYYSPPPPPPMDCRCPANLYCGQHLDHWWCSTVQDSASAPSARSTHIRTYIQYCIHIHLQYIESVLYSPDAYKQTKTLHMKHLEWFKLKVQGILINCQLPLMMCLTHGLETHCMYIRMYVSETYNTMSYVYKTTCWLANPAPAHHCVFTVQDNYECHLCMHMVSITKQLAIDSHFELYDFTQ